MNTNATGHLGTVLPNTLIEKIIALAHADEDIRAIILEGSLAAGFQVDELSDYDVNIYIRV